MLKNVHVCARARRWAGRENATMGQNVTTDIAVGLFQAANLSLPANSTIFVPYDKAFKK